MSNQSELLPNEDRPTTIDVTGDQFIELCAQVAAPGATFEIVWFERSRGGYRVQTRRKGARPREGVRQPMADP
jgi:hypothetical protein